MLLSHSSSWPKVRPTALLQAAGWQGAWNSISDISACMSGTAPQSHELALLSSQKIKAFFGCGDLDP